MPAAAGSLVAALTDAAPRVGLLLGLGLGRPVAVEATAVRRAALREVATPDAVWSTLSCGLPDAGLLLVPCASAVGLADLALGGAGECEDRPVTTLEQQLVVQHLAPALRPLGDALADHGVTGLAVGAPTDRPLPVGLGEVLAVELSLQLPTAVAPLTVCLPARSLLPADVEPSVATPTPAAARALGDVPVELALRVPASTMTAQEAEDLHPGDVIRIDAECLSSVVGVLAGDGEDVPVLTGALGRRGKHRAVVVGPVGGV